jgi:TraM recognition site of TraD and TraG
VVYLTQNRSNYFAESPGDAGRNRVASMCACLKTQILHQCSHEETRRAFSDAIGKHRITRTSNTRNFGKGAPTHSETEQMVDDYWVLPDSATKLKTGGPANKYQVEAIVTKAGKRFSNGKPAMLVKFDQRTFERSSWGSRTTVAIAKPKQSR